jgi:hypothetical protein
MRIRVLATTAVAALISTLVVAPIATATEFQGFPMDSNIQALTIEELVDIPYSFIVNDKVFRDLNDGKVVETPEATKLCDEFNTHGCNLNSSTNLSVRSVLPVCKDVIENCIQGFEIIDKDGKAISAVFNRTFKGKTFSGVEQLGMPGGSRPSLWDVPGAMNLGGTEKYVVNAKIDWSYRAGVASVEGFHASIYAIKENINGKYREPGIFFGPTFQGVYASVTETGEINYDGSCVATEAGFCAEKVEFAPGTRIKLSLKVSNKVTGWLHGRISKPTIEVTPLNPMFNSLVVEADTVEVPMMYAKFDKTVESKDFVNQYDNSPYLGRGFFGTNFWRQYYPDNPFASRAVTALAASVKDTATEVHTYWNLTSISTGSQNSCLKDTSKLVGFVTTNAMAYSGSAPTWDGSSLEYKVAGLHYLPDGKTLTSGTYDLAMRSETARCLYGFSKAPISASISVVSADGVQKVATTTLREKDGWLYLAAYGFTFSAPTIKIKLTQAKAKKSKSLTCYKGKQSKVIKGVNPKCPAGYKAK